MDDLEKAILFSFDQTGAVNTDLKLQAQAYCEEVKRGPDFWHVCVQKFFTSEYAEVQFWCLMFLEDTLRKRLFSSPQAEFYIRNSLMSAATDGIIIREVNGPSTSAQIQRIPSQKILSKTPPYIKNKLSHLIVLLISMEYPMSWESVFLDFLEAIPQELGILDIFCRVLNSLDDELISLDYPRSPQESEIAMRVKDGMRQQCLPQIVNLWYQVVFNFQSTNPEVCVAVLETMQRFISWMDIGLVANDRWVPVFFRILSNQSEPSNLRASVAGCLLAVISKRMEVPSKLALLKQLQIADVCSMLVSTLDLENSTEFQSLVVGYGNELLECVKRAETDGNGQRIDNTVSTAREMLDQAMPLVFAVLRKCEGEINESSVSFLLSFVSNFKRMASYEGTQQLSHLDECLSVTFPLMKYRSDMESSLDAPDKYGIEAEERMEESRKDLFTLFKNIARVAPAVAQGFVHRSLQNLLANPASDFADSEAVLSLFHQLGEGLTEEDLKPESGPLPNLTAVLLNSPVPHQGHRLVALSTMEILVRYSRFVQQNPQFIPTALSVFLGERGVLNPNPLVSSRACYLFARLAKTLRVQLLPYIDGIVQVR